MSVLRPICPVCQTRKKLLCCQGCKVMLYCCREHQITDRNNHKVACNAVKRARDAFEREDQELRRAPSNFFLPANVFETGAGNFYEIVGTQDYIKARHSLICKLVKINTYDAVKSAFSHAMDTLHLCHLDHLGVRFIVQALFIRLGMDQECYDFIKWYAGNDMKTLDDWRNKIVPFLNVKDTDVFEPVSAFYGKCFLLESALALILIKMRLLNDVRMLQNSFFLYDLLPPELVDRIRKDAISTKIVSKRKDIFKDDNHKPLIKTLEEQIKELFMVVNDKYKPVWPNLLDPKDSLALKHARYKFGSEKYCQITVQNFYEAYAETPFAIEMIRGMVEKGGAR